VSSLEHEQVLLVCLECDRLTRSLKFICRLIKNLIGVARDGSTSRGVRVEYVDARRLSATKHMSFF
jgi:hypothetical protein